MGQPAEGLIYKKMIAILSETKAISKDRKNQQQNYNFRGIDDVYNELHDIFASNGVVPVPRVLKTTREERTSAKGGLIMYTIMEVEYTFFAEDGSSVVSVMAGEGMDSGDKSLNKAASSAIKNALFEIFLIPTKDNKDTENDNPDPKSKAEVEREQCLTLIEQATTVTELTNLKAKYLSYFTGDNGVIEAGTKKYNLIMGNKMLENGTK